MFLTCRDRYQLRTSLGSYGGAVSAGMTRTIKYKIYFWWRVSIWGRYIQFYFNSSILVVSNIQTFETA